MAFGAVAGFLISCLATAMLISGMIMDDWIAVDKNTIGPFRSCQKKKCVIEIPDNGYLKACSGLLVCSLMANCCSLFLSAVCMCIRKQWRQTLLSSMAVISGVAGICSLAALLFWMGKFASLEIPTTAFGNGWLMLPFSILASWLHVAACVYLNIEAKKKLPSPSVNQVNGVLKPGGGTGFSNLNMPTSTGNQTNAIQHSTADQDDVGIDLCHEYDGDQHDPMEHDNSSNVEFQRNSYQNVNGANSPSHPREVPEDSVLVANPVYNSTEDNQAMNDHQWNINDENSPKNEENPTDYDDSIREVFHGGHSERHENIANDENSD